jgi:hypothetical protein
MSNSFLVHFGCAGSSLLKMVIAIDGSVKIYIYIYSMPVNSVGDCGVQSTYRAALTCKGCLNCPVGKISRFPAFPAFCARLRGKCAFWARVLHMTYG